MMDRDRHRWTRRELRGRAGLAHKTASLAGDPPPEPLNPRLPPNLAHVEQAPSDPASDNEAVLKFLTQHGATRPA
jgi:hypothetical protein